ncbi:uncharacterized transporter [[Candida] railenensis]|uniref:Uncharacterized transporter n=1 Tax=[Candida] railenensis TaxID=45579 RepID=A0A9P0VWU8_9ASCO|nr:uncharacterized transporter [[Candida] railenensis]
MDDIPLVVASAQYNSADEEDIPLVAKKSHASKASVYSLESIEEVDDINPFLDPDVATYYRQVYDQSQYECRAYFDPELRWSKEEEKDVLGKLDRKAALFACIMFIGLQIDRGNLGQAVSDNMLNDLNLTTDDYNTANTIFLIMFILAELPSQLISKWMGPDRWIPLQMISWSVIASLQSFVTGKKSFFLARGLTALLSGGFIPTMVLWLSYFYKSSELPLRLSWFWTTLSLVQITTSILAFGILRLRGLLGWEGWRWLFLIEGGFTFIIGICSIHMMVPSIVHTRTLFTPRGWFNGNERELKIAVNRILRDDPTKGDMNNRQSISLAATLQSLLDYDLWPVYCIGLIAYIPTNTVSNYLTITLKNLGWSTFNVNLLTIPHNLFHIVMLLGVTKFSERLNERSLISLLVPLWLLPLLAILCWWEGSMVNAWGTWVLCNLILGAPYIHAICVSWVSRNSGSIRTRSVSSAVYNICVQAGGIIAANVYKSDDAPLYKRGNLRLFWISFTLIPLLLGTKWYYTWRNATKEKIWNSMSPEHRYIYMNKTSEEGNKRLDFRFAS